MICKNCGAENPDGNLFCFNCGMKQNVKISSNNGGANSTTQSTTLPGTNTIQNNTNQNYNTQNTFNQNNSTQTKSGGGLGIASMVLGIVSIVFMCTPWIGFICSVLAIVFACIEKKHNGFRTSGLILGIIGLSLRLIVPLLGLMGIMFSAPFFS